MLSRGAIDVVVESSPKEISRMPSAKSSTAAIGAKNRGTIFFSILSHFFKTIPILSLYSLLWINARPVYLDWHFLDSKIFADSHSLLAFPVADAALNQELLDLVQQASHYRQLKKGANEGRSRYIIFHQTFLKISSLTDCLVLLQSLRP